MAWKCSFFGIFLERFLSKMEKNWVTNSRRITSYINHKPVIGMIAFDYAKLRLNCIFTVYVNTSMSRFEILTLTLISEFNHYYW